MMAKILLATLLGAFSGMVAATGGEIWQPSAGPETAYAARTVARVETAWNALRAHAGR